MDPITVKTTIKSDIEKVWDCWTKPEHIVQWNFASDDWHCPSAENEVKPGGTFSWHMAAKDGSVGFDFKGTYDLVVDHKVIHQRLDDGREVNLQFNDMGESEVEVIEIFQPDAHDPELQRQGWQAILDNFKKYVEAG